MAALFAHRGPFHSDGLFGWVYAFEGRCVSVWAGCVFIGFGCAFEYQFARTDFVKK